MATTVKSLEERLESMLDDYSSLRDHLTKIDTRMNRVEDTLNSLNNQLKITDETIKHLDLQLNRSILDSSVFQGKTNTAISLMRWIGIFVAGTSVTIVFALFSVAHQAGKLDATVQQLQDTLNKSEAARENQNKLLWDINRELSEIKAKVK